MVAHQRKITFTFPIFASFACLINMEFPHIIDHAVIVPLLPGRALFMSKQDVM